MTKRCGFVGIVGLTNVGKSTLINDLVGSKVSIVSHKVQTTRQRILGMCVVGETQLILVDTPGYFKPQRRLDKAMISSALTAPLSCDITFVLVDPLASHLSAHLNFLDKLKFPPHNPVTLVINKIDLVEKLALLEAIQKFTHAHTFEKVFLISALKGQGVSDLRDYLQNTLPEGPWLFPEDQLSDMPQRLLAAEITREKIYKHLHQELPYGIHVETIKWEAFKDGSIKLDQVIHVQKPSHKSIVLGEQGKKIKQIGIEARHDLKEILETPVHLSLFVRVTKNWAENPSTYKILGLDFNASGED
jgi:GTP-binding protein Era